MFPMMALSQVAQPIQRSIEVLPGTNYRTIGVKWWGEGAYERVTIDGTQTAAKTLTLVKENDLIINKIWVRNGSTAIASRKVDGCAASGEFPTFELDQTKVFPRWLHWITKTKGFWHKCDVLSQGTSGKNRIRPELFLTITIPLPPIEEQRRIVARIEELAAKIEEARGLRRESVEEADKLVEELEFQLWPDEDVKNNSCSLEEVTVFLSRGRYSEQGYSDHYLIKTQHVQLGKYIKSQFTLDSEIAERVQPEATVKKGDVLIACSAAGCLGRVAQFMEDQLASTDTHVAIARANTMVILPEYLYAYLKGAQGQIQLRSRERGDWTREKVGFRLTELNLADLKRVPVPVPSIPEQRNLLERLENLQSKLNIIKGNQSVTSAELNALLPSILDKAFKGEL
jgi:type I restriction enzyme S subunit